ncbi:MAG: GreA/GreB family elongation factor [Chthoniobacterales bacterium]|nr:GreA/GreB family elongation factor [Chthoniobacterales bacterium]
MSRAFVKEDIDPPERSRRARAASGLPPGATNYITATGAARLRHQLARLRRDDAAADHINDLQALLASITIVEPPEEAEGIVFGARVTIRGATGERTFRIVGVDELTFYPDAVSWISPEGKALLAAELGGRVSLENDERAEVIAVDYPVD